MGGAVLGGWSQPSPAQKGSGSPCWARDEVPLGWPPGLRLSLSPAGSVPGGRGVRWPPGGLGPAAGCSARSPPASGSPSWGCWWGGAHLWPWPCGGGQTQLWPKGTWWLAWVAVGVWLPSPAGAGCRAQTSALSIPGLHLASSPQRRLQDTTASASVSWRGCGAAPW